jgi:aminopeptidase Y
MPGHIGTLSYIYEEILKLGDYYEISNQSFPAVSGNVFESRLVLGDQVPKSAAPMGLTPPTKDKEPVHGNLILVDNEGCQSTDFPDSVAGNIAFIKRGICPFGTKSENAGRKGAIAAIVYNYEKDPVSGTLGSPSPYHVATFGLSGEEADPVIEKLRNKKSVRFLRSTVLLKRQRAMQTTVSCSERIATVLRKVQVSTTTVPELSP